MTALDFLQKHQFFAYKNTKQYLAQLDQEIHHGLSSKNPFNLSIKWPKDKQLKPSTRSYSMELGGTYLRLYQGQIKANQVKILRSKQLNFYQDITYTPAIIFRELTEALNNFIPTVQRAKVDHLDFVFSFALKPLIRKNRLLDGKIINFGKTRKNSGLINLQIGKNLEKYLRQNGYPLIEISVINDSISNLLARKTLEISEKKNKSSLQNPLTSSPILINLISGSGTNISLAYQQADQLNLINLEFGNFSTFPLTSFDKKISTETMDHQTEKMFAGNWQNQLLRIIAEKLLEEKLVTQLPHPKIFQWSSAELEKYFSTQGKAPLNPAEKTQQQAFLILQTIWQEINRRGAFICAFTLNRIIQILSETSPTSPSSSHVSFTPPTIILSGGMLENPTIFRQSLKKFLKIPKTRLVIQPSSTLQIPFQICYN